MVIGHCAPANLAFHKFSSKDVNFTKRHFSSTTDDQDVKNQKQQKIELPTRKQFVPRERSVPSTQTQRFLHFGGLAFRLAVGQITAAAATVKNNDKIQSVTNGPAKDEKNFLSECSAEKIAQSLCEMRGAALKLGQLLSIQDETIVPPAIQKALDRVRNSADVMPRNQLHKVMISEFGSDWKNNFQTFEELPFAAASIGQVHRAVLKDGTEVAVKVQYPGVAESIDSDIKNLKRVLKIANFLPKGMFAEDAINQIREELVMECDYLNESNSQKKFRELLKGDTQLYVPKVFDHLTTRKVLTTEMIHGLSMDQVAETLDQETRNMIAYRLLHLTNQELFEFRFMQTDPNWSNFFYDPKTGKINLIDFGACRPFSKPFVDNYMKIVYGAAQKDRNMILEASKKLGFFSGDESKAMVDAHVDSALIIGEPFASLTDYDYRTKEISKKVKPLTSTMMNERLIPLPREVYTLHRKLSGAYLLCVKLQAVIPSRQSLMSIYAKYVFD